jgi:hypothetical protein
MLRILLQRFAQDDGAIKNKQRSPASFPAGPFVKLPELSGHCHAASAGAAGAATAEPVSLDEIVVALVSVSIAAIKSRYFMILSC